MIGGPIVGGLMGAYFGYDNLSKRLNDERQQDRIEDRQKAVQEGLDNLAIPVETLRRYEKIMASQKQKSDVLDRLLTQSDQLQTAIKNQSKFTGRIDQQEALIASEHILNEIRQLLGHVRTAALPGGNALIIKTAENTFHVTFPVPMRIPPRVTFTYIPDGATPNVLENSKVGFTVVFTPSSIPVDVFRFEANAEL
jgi:hypothetical protein